MVSIRKSQHYYLWLHLSFRGTAVVQHTHHHIFNTKRPNENDSDSHTICILFFYFFFFNTHCSDARSRFFRPPTVKYTQDWSHTIIVPNRINNPSNISPITKSYNTKRLSTLKIRFLFFIQYKLPQRLELSAHRCRVKKMGDVIPKKQQRRGRWGGEG